MSNFKVKLVSESNRPFVKGRIYKAKPHPSDPSKFLLDEHVSETFCKGTDMPFNGLILTFEKVGGVEKKSIESTYAEADRKKAAAAVREIEGYLKEAIDAAREAGIDVKAEVSIKMSHQPETKVY